MSIYSFRPSLSLNLPQHHHRLGSIVDLVQDCGLETLHMFQCLGVRWPMARLKVVCGKACRCVCFSERCVFSCRSWSARKTKQSPSLDGACIATATNRLPHRHLLGANLGQQALRLWRQQKIQRRAKGQSEKISHSICPGFSVVSCVAVSTARA